MTESPYTCFSAPPNGGQLVARRAGRSVVRNDVDTSGAHEYIVNDGDFHLREYRMVPYFAAATVAEWWRACLADADWTARGRFGSGEFPSSGEKLFTMVSLSQFSKNTDRLRSNYSK